MSEYDGCKIVIVEPALSAAYKQLRLRGLQEHPEAFGESASSFADKPLEAIQQQIQTGMRTGGVVLAALSQSGSMVGAVGLAVTDSEKTRHRGLLWGMYVLPEARGQGIATRLIEDLIKRAEEMPQLEQIHLAVVTTNLAAIRIYKALGFSIYGTDPRVIRIESTYFDEYLMVRGLRGSLR